MWSPRWGFESNSKNKPRPRPPRSPCVVPPSALWGPQNAACYFQEPTEADRLGTRRAARRGAPIQAPARTKAAGRQQQLFFFSRSGPIPPASVRSAAGMWQNVCVCVPLPLERPTRCRCQPLLHQNAGCPAGAKALTRLCPPECLPDGGVAHRETLPSSFPPGA